MPADRRSRWTLAIAALGLATAVGVGIHARLEDPLSSPVIPAEDPYTHMALVREHLRDGRLDPLNERSGLYPPGMHALLGAVWTYTGLPLYDLVRFAPVAFGALAVVGIGLLLWRQEGPAAGFVGALALAVTPEIVFRTTMMAPTAVDVALLPFFLYALMRTVGGTLPWAGALAAVTLFILLSHPWLLPILALSGGLFLLVTLLWPWQTTRGPPVSLWGAAVALLILGWAAALSLAGCWGTCGSGFRDVLPDGQRFGALTPTVAAAAALPLLVLAMAPAARRRMQAWLTARHVAPRGSPNTRLAAALLLAVLLVAVTVPALQAGLPQFVDRRMIGWPVLILAAAGLVAWPLLRSPLAHASGALVAATYPFVIYNPLDSEFWPHRTAVYLAVGLALMAGIAAGAAARLAYLRVAAASRGAPASAPARGPGARSATVQRRAAAIPVRAGLAALLVAVVVGGGVVAGTHNEYGTWYRLYTPCEMEVLRSVAREADANPDLLVVTGDWQSKLVLAALAKDASRIWYKGDFFTSERQRADLMEAQDGLVVVVDRYLSEETPRADTTFLQSQPWQAGPASCPPGTQIQTYRTE